MHPRETVERALANARLGMSDRENARICDVPIGTLRHWKYGNRRAPETEERRVLGDCPRCRGRGLDEGTYSYLLGLYLGDGHIARTHRQRVYRLEIYCADDWPGLLDLAAETITRVMPTVKVGRRQQTGCTGIGGYSSHWPCLFPQHGPGMKHTRKIELQNWQQAIVEEFPREFVRGLIHSDGCRAMNRITRRFKSGDRIYQYPRYFFTNASDDIRGLFTDALDRLGIAWRQSNARTVSVAKREAVARLDEFVGPKY